MNEWNKLINYFVICKLQKMQQLSGSLHIIVGPMFSGKSSSLIGNITKYADIGLEVLYINHSDDYRDDEMNTVFSTHSSHFKGKKFNNSKIKAIKASSLSKIDIEGFQVIGIDECQFFDDLDFVVKEWVNKRDKIVFCAGLDGDSNMNAFGKTLNLIPCCDTIKKLTAKCLVCIENLKNSKDTINIPVCCDYTTIISNAPFTGKFGGSYNQKEIGGIDIYKPLCRYHFFNK